MPKWITYPLTGTRGSTETKFQRPLIFSSRVSNSACNIGIACGQGGKFPSTSCFFISWIWIREYSILWINRYIPLLKYASSLKNVWALQKSEGIIHREDEAFLSSICLSHSQEAEIYVKNNTCSAKSFQFWVNKYPRSTLWNLTFER